jgi:hypothetical protein
MYLLQPFFPEACDQERARAVFHERIAVGGWEFSRLLRTTPVEYRLKGSHVVGRTTEAQSRRLITSFDAIQIASFDEPRKSSTNHGNRLRQQRQLWAMLVHCLSGPSTKQRGRLRYQDWQEERLVKLNKRQPPTVFERLARSFAG